MDFTTSHRTIGARYGKNKGRAKPHDFYNIPLSATTVLPATQFPISPSSAGNELPDRHDAITPTKPPSPSPARSVRPAHVTSHSRSSMSASGASRSTSPPKHDPEHPNGPKNSAFNLLSSTYDMLSSDEDLEAVERRPMKRLRLSPVERGTRQGVASSTTKRTTKDENKDKRALASKQSSNGVKKAQERSKEKTMISKHTTGDVAIVEPKTAIITPRENPPLRSRPQRPENSRQNLERIKRDMSEESMQNQTLNKPERTPRKSRSKLKSRALRKETPNTPRHPLQDSDSSGASPSQLGLHHLRLIPEPGPESSAQSESPAANDTAPRLPHSRKRLVDRLDAATTQPAVRAELAAQTFAKEIERLHRGKGTDASQPRSNIPSLSRSGSSQTRQTYGRSRNTYAKERSHLSDMVDDLEALSAGSNQSGSQQLLSGLTSTGPSQLQSQFDVESDSSDHGPSFRLQSVHELKQAGTNNRLEKEIEDLMSDMYPARASKATRVQTLTQVLRKMAQERFLSFFFEQALDRLTAWSSLMKDKISKFLLGMVFWRLIQCGATSPPRLKQMIQAVIAISSSLPPLDTIAQLAKDRNENLSKSTIRDLIEFEQAVLSEGLLPGYEGESIVAAAITLGALNDSLRRLVEVGSITPLPQSSYAQIVALLEQASQPSGDQPVKHVFVTKLSLSLLQLCAGPLEQDFGLTEAEYCALGDNLAGVAQRAMGRLEGLLQATLHFMISLCNDKPEICRAVCSSNFTNTLMLIIRSRLLGLVEAAEKLRTVEPAALDSVILTLACLLNLTEHDDQTRLALAHSKFDESSATHLSILIKTYTEAAPKLTSAKTTEQGSALVVLGYLSLLICNLCLHGELWQGVSDQLGQEYSMSDIVASAKELLIHLRTIETADESNTNEKGSTALDGFTARFGQILSSIRLE